jgi:ADP-ribose pyrophosphatase
MVSAAGQDENRRMKVTDIEVLSDEGCGPEGFLLLRRLRVCNVRDDGSRSPPYLLDVVERSMGADAVAVLAFQEHASGEVQVLLRQGLRPCIKLGRQSMPTRESRTPTIYCIEAVAGVLEEEDQGLDGLRRRVSAELHEEVGLEVDPQTVFSLGPSALLSPGIMAERIYFCAVEACLEKKGNAVGDGTALEEGGQGIIYALREALALCRAGELQDVKTELALRRLAEHLEGQGKVSWRAR